MTPTHLHQLRAQTRACKFRNAHPAALFVAAAAATALMQPSFCLLHVRWQVHAAGARQHAQQGRAQHVRPGSCAASPSHAQATSVSRAPAAALVIAVTTAALTRGCLTGPRLSEPLCPTSEAACTMRHRHPRTHGQLCTHCTGSRAINMAVCAGGGRAQQGRLMRREESHRGGGRNAWQRCWAGAEGRGALQTPACAISIALVKEAKAVHLQTRACTSPCLWGVLRHGSCRGCLDVGHQKGAEQGRHSWCH